MPKSNDVERLALERDKPPRRVNVACIAPDAAVSLRAVLSGGALRTTAVMADGLVTAALAVLASSRRLTCLLQQGRTVP